MLFETLALAIDRVGMGVFHGSAIDFLRHLRISRGWGRSGALHGDICCRQHPLLAF